MTTGERHDCVLTTWPSVITRSSVSQHDLTAARGNVPSSSFSRPNTWRVVVSSLLPVGGGGEPRTDANCCQRYKQTLRCGGGFRTSGLLYFFGAELGCGGGRRVVAGGVVPEQEVAPSEDGADALLRCLAHLETTRGRFLNPPLY